MPTNFAILRSRSLPILDVQPRTPPVGSSLGPRLARHLARHLWLRVSARSNLVEGA